MLSYVAVNICSLLLGCRQWTSVTCLLHAVFTVLYESLFIAFSVFIFDFFVFFFSTYLIITEHFVLCIAQCSYAAVIYRLLLPQANIQVSLLYHAVKIMLQLLFMIEIMKTGHLLEIR